MQVIGLCRFSYPAQGGFQVEHASIEERCRYLYSQPRMEERFRLFEAIAMPCLQEQTDPDFTFVVLVGDNLPKPHLERLNDLIVSFPQARIVTAAPGPHREVMKRVLNQARNNPQDPCLQFRHDDDDAVSVDFVERLRQTAADCPGLIAKNRTVAIDFNKGFVAEASADGLAVTEIHRPYYTAAMGMYVRGGCQLSIMNFGHERIARFMPSVTISDAPMFVRTHNGYNDSRQKKAKPLPLAPLTPELSGEFEARFAIREDDVRNAFSKQSR